jgi:hypothetical protein
MQYSYQFSDDLQQEWEWTERYASQPEILRYLEHIADRFSLRPHLQFHPTAAVDFTDQRVGVIGTGSSAVPSIPVIAEQARNLVVFQRTATYSVPAWNGPIDHVNAIADFTLFPTCNSWYLGANVPGKTRFFMPCLGFPPVRGEMCRCRPSGLRGFYAQYAIVESDRCHSPRYGVSKRFVKEKNSITRFESTFLNTLS